MHRVGIDAEASKARKHKAKSSRLLRRFELAAHVQSNINMFATEEHATIKQEYRAARKALLDHMNKLV